MPVGGAEPAVVGRDRKNDCAACELKVFFGETEGTRPVQGLVAHQVNELLAALAQETLHRITAGDKGQAYRWDDAGRADLGVICEPQRGQRPSSALISAEHWEQRVVIIR